MLSQIVGQLLELTAGIIMVSVQALTNFVFIPVQPFWAIILIVVDLWVIHSLFVHRRERV